VRAASIASTEARVTTDRRGPPGRDAGRLEACATLPPMSELPVRWSKAAVEARPDARRPAMSALPAGGPPDAATLFAFMRDAELRFRTLRMRIEERTWGAAGERLLIHEILVRHPGLARVTVRHADREMPRDHEVWVSDGVRIRTFSAVHDVATDRPARRHLGGLDSSTLPSTSRVYVPLTRLPIDSVAEVAIHPGTYLQNVVGTGAIRVVGGRRVAGREAIEVECLHPRTTRIAADQPDHEVVLAADAALGVLSLLEQRLGDTVARRAEATSIEPDAEIPDSAFDLAIPATARRVY
jgi:hypothetical protein